MRPEERDSAFLWDMREAVLQIAEFVGWLDHQSFASDPRSRDAVERQLIVLGEAAKRVSPAFKSAHPEVPWHLLVGQRNLLAHEYGEIPSERVWLAATGDVPELLDLLDPLVPLPPREDS